MSIESGNSILSPDILLNNSIESGNSILSPDILLNKSIESGNSILSLTFSWTSPLSLVTVF